MADGDPAVARRDRRRCSGASCPTAGTPRSRASRPTRRGWRPARPRNKVVNAIARAVPVADRRLGRPHRLGLGPARRSTAPATSSRSSCDGRQLHYGIREHESAAISNGLSLCKLRPVWSTYLTFSDYARPGDPPLGADGAAGRSTSSPTTRSASARTGRPTSRSSSSPRCGRCPGLDVIRPADANEVAEAWRVSMRPQPPAGRAGPDPPERAGARPRASTPRRRGCARGGYVLADAEGGDPEVILIATGSEVALARRRPRGAGRGGGPRARRQPALLGAVRPPGRRPTARASCRRAVHRPGRGRAGLDAGLGPLRRRRRDGSSACTPSAPRRR